MARKMPSVGIRRASQTEGVDIFEVVRETTAEYLFDRGKSLRRIRKGDGIRLHYHPQLDILRKGMA